VVKLIHKFYVVYLIVLMQAYSQINESMPQKD